MIYAMKDGEIIQKGDFSELFECEDGFFRKLWNKQQL